MTTDALTESVLHLLYAFIGPTPLYVNCYLSNSNTGLLPTGLKQTGTDGCACAIIVHCTKN